MADSYIEESEHLPEKEESVEWGYEEGVEWGLIFPDANGEYQSPINLNSREAKYDPLLLEVRLSPNYVVCRDCEVINDGHSVQILLKSKSVLVGGPLPRGHEFELHDARFHWGRENQRGSEHTVNFKAFPMELHLVHWNSTMYRNIDEAIGKKNGIAIIALFVQELSRLMLIVIQMEQWLSMFCISCPTNHSIKNVTPITIGGKIPFWGRGMDIYFSTGILLLYLLTIYNAFKHMCKNGPIPG
uniref:Carbonic anhydrase n=1 Tax=Pogona vitticeps TaxID=103695 RepID=A0ABM5GBP9_9SAUR